MPQSKNYILHTRPRRILVIAMRYLGDMLLTTPLIHSIHEAYPDCELDVLVYRNTAAMLEGNPHIHHVITIEAHPRFSDQIALFKALFRRYDLAFVTETGDRRYFYAMLAAPVRIGFVPDGHAKGRWKRHLACGWIEEDIENTHRVLELLKLAGLVNIPPVYSLTLPLSDEGQGATTEISFSLPAQYVVLHTYPQWNYKRWNVQNWITIGKFLASMKLKLVLSGGPSPEEIEYVAGICNQLPEDTVNLAGRTSLAQLADIIANARLFIGPDTGTTHLAAATGIPVIAIYGPTNPVRWAPWPIDYQQWVNPFRRVGSQKVNNINLIQGEAECVPCGFEGCDRHRQSYSRCLDTLAVERVRQVIEEILE